MGLKDPLPPHILDKMVPEDRRLLGKSGMTVEEAQDRYFARLEKKEHRIFNNWCLLHQIPYREDRMDKRTTGPVGWPDYLIVYSGRCLLMEFKISGSKLSQNQAQVHAHLARTGTEVLVCYSADEAIRKARGWLWEHFRWEPEK